MATLALTAAAQPVPACTQASHDYLRKHAWHLLEPLRAARYMPTVDEQGKPCLLEMRNCACCHSTLCREVPLMSIADAEREVLRVWRVERPGYADPAAFELRSMARKYFTGDDE